MGSLFQVDGFLYRSINKIMDVIGLSLLWLITSLPIITIGASTSALYYTTYHSIRYDRGKVWSSYWKSFLGSFKQATIPWLLLMVFAYILGVNGYAAFMLYTVGNSSRWIFLPFLVSLFAILMWAVYVFPMVGRFQNPTKLVIKNSFLINLRNLPWSFLLACLCIISMVVVLLVPFALAYIPAAYMLISSFILERIFVKYMSPEDAAMERERNKREANAH